MAEYYKGGLEYIDLNYKPSERDLICKYYLEPSEGIEFNQACEHIAAESSIGTWTDIGTMKPEIARKLKPHIFQIDKKNKEIKIAYPSDLFEEGNMPGILSSIAGNIFGMKSVENLRLQDVEFPKDIIKSFKGPRFGIPGVRKIVKVKDRPLVGTIIKPKVGLQSKEHAVSAYNSWLGGCDIVKDDENLTSQNFNPFEKRIKETIKLRDKAEKETGEKKIYMPNITSETREMIRRAKFVKSQGCEYIMVDILTVGFSALQTIVDENLNLVIHAHRAMHAAITRNPRHGISMLTIAKISRLIGMDQLHIGTVVGKMEGSMDETVGIKNSIIKEWYGINPTFPVCSGGLHPALVPKLVEILGKDIIIQAGGGIHGHPEGTVKGAIAMRQAVDAVMDGISIEEYAKNHEELRLALEKWG